MKHLIVIFGASGYIGKKLVKKIAAQENYLVRVVSRNPGSNSLSAGTPQNIEIVKGDLNSYESLDEILEPDCTVVNLTYFWGSGELKNLLAIRNLLTKCEEVGIKRLIHFSTAAVSGRVPCNIINEESPCLPITEYGITKLKIERLIFEDQFHFARVILRPTAVYGPEGAPLEQLAIDLLTGNQFKNYLKACLFGARRMNLVHIDNVVGATIFLVGNPKSLDRELFIVSDDQDENNNFKESEHLLKLIFRKNNYLIKPIYLPLIVLSIFLRILGRNNINPKCNYSQKKLEEKGFIRTENFSSGLLNYAHWYYENQKNLVKR